MRSVAIFAVLILASFNSVAETEERPKLVVGIVVDAMKYDYIARFWNHYGDDGFKRLIGDGFSCRNMNYNYTPTFTGCGHASVYSGTTPKYHGIIGNNWYSKTEDRSIYCSEDMSVKSVGVSSSKGQMSPKNMLVSGLADELKIASMGRSKVVGLSIKDRGATLPAGHSADAAYWMTDRWISSSYYMDELPKWVQKFNKKMDQFYPKVWNTLKPIDTYLESWTDDNEYEYTFNGMDRPVFPYDLEKLMPENGGINMIKSTPFGNTITTAFAKEAILNEKLGKGDATDMIAISYSSPDYLGHMFGPQAKEVQDNYLRLDGDIADLLAFLDREIGAGEYLVFLTADHGGAMVPAHMTDMKLPGGIIDVSSIQSEAKVFMAERFGLESVVLNYINDQFSLDHEAITAGGHNPEKVARAMADFLLKFEEVFETYTAWDMRFGSFPEGAAASAQRGFNHKRSGDVVVVYKPGWIEYGSKGSTHGSTFRYDTHVPALFYGWGITPGSTDRQVGIDDIAPTVSTLLQISFPNAATGHPILEITEPKK